MHYLRHLFNDQLNLFDQGVRDLVVCAGMYVVIFSVVGVCSWFVKMTTWWQRAQKEADNEERVQ
jgi:hypothetical protein